ncbi:MAG TPA: class I SAM-dependent methyltransferase [Pyrinomonadaceae bacterium]|nr:class I SAM-dependent methyltransferase [Pyrinomonadaceae bacterium]
MPTAVEQIINQKEKVVEQYGEWTAHNIHLADNVYTISDQIRGDEVLARRVLQIVSDVLKNPLSMARILDLACLEGLYAVEFAQHGAQTVGVEIREANLAKARFVKETLALDNLKLVQDDVRNLSSDKYGHFDAVLCIGILYHLDAPDVFDFVHRMAEVCTGCLVIDTHVSNTKEVSSKYGEREYWGKFFTEHEPDTTLAEREKSLWASIDNVKSFWLTRPSLYNLLAHAGFTSVYECYNPPVWQKFDDRCTLLAIKGEPQEVLSAPSLLAAASKDWSENSLQAESPRVRSSGLRSFGKILPAPVKNFVKKLAG